MKTEKIISTIVSILLFILAFYLFVRMMIGLKYYDDDTVWIYGFTLFGLVSIITILRITLNDLCDIWKKKRKK